MDTHLTVVYQPGALFLSLSLSCFFFLGGGGGEEDEGEGVNCLVVYLSHFYLKNFLLKILQISLLLIFTPALNTDVGTYP